MAACTSLPRHQRQPFLVGRPASRAIRSDYQDLEGGFEGCWGCDGMEPGWQDVVVGIGGGNGPRRMRHASRREATA